MFKKGLSLMVTAAFALMLSTATFAGIQLNPVEKGDITLIEPQIGTERQVFVKDSMAISIRSEADYPVYVSLYKVMPSAHNAYLDEACESELILTSEDVPFTVISGGSIIAKDSDSDDNNADSEADQNDDGDGEKKSKDSDKIIDGTQALLQTDRLSSKDRQAVIKAFKSARKDFTNELEELEEAYDDYMDMFPSGHEDGYEYSSDELDVIKTYLNEVEEAKEECTVYTNARMAYEAIFEIPLFGPEDLTDTGILPYYQKTVEKITPGLYKFVFEDTQNNETINVIEFEVVKKEELTEEDIKGAMPSTLGDLILPAADQTNDADDDNKNSDKNNSGEKSTSDDALDPKPADKADE